MIRPYNKAEVSFELRTEIGQEGRNSRTYLATDPQLDAEIVIKQVQKTKISSVDDFFSESKILYLSSHPNVVQIFYACQDGDHIYIAMPYYKNGSLSTLINSRFLTVREVVSFGCQIASGLHNIHSKKLLHFDIKPDNVLISDRGEALVSDFGLSKQINFSGVAQQDRLYYKMTPPEALAGYDFTISFDIYQLGLTLYRMCNGNSVFYQQFHAFGADQATFDSEAFRFALRNGRFPDRAYFLPHIPEKLRRIIKKCLEPDVANRYSSALEVANALADIDGKSLDWQFTLTQNEKVWKKQDGEREYTLTLAADGSSRAVKVVNDGNPTRITSYCKTDLSSRDLKKFFGEY